MLLLDSQDLRSHESKHSVAIRASAVWSIRGILIMGPDLDMTRPAIQPTVDRTGLSSIAGPTHITKKRGSFSIDSSDPSQYLGAPPASNPHHDVTYLVL